MASQQAIADAAGFEPPEEWAGQEGWHTVETADGARCLLFRPAIGIWRDQDGQRWTTRTAGELGWRWIGLAATPAPAARK